MAETECCFVRKDCQEPPYADPHVRWCGSREGKPSRRPDYAFVQREPPEISPFLTAYRRSHLPMMEKDSANPIMVKTLIDSRGEATSG